ncbi:cadherin domain-containing protein [Noviherbaspirillum sedimenti]|uniref:Type I secretion C-terminal target domain-containing protein n=1 Tax=Noviherbaspirillum sedimenti TaxID=2320865 RepID=A0A3A3G0V1_9BURK|nr:cadherin domain-containing protein [Noviherbaspirillum sedimenti]RJG01265.1 type I secretion C-terminal target domain-containing protein [Noviherbaspirillum sedimenti]
MAIINGTINADTLDGTSNNDVITGNGGADLLSGNGGADRFVYAVAADSVPNANWAVPPDGTVTRTWDVITDFTQGVDKIDVSAFLGATDLAWGNTTPNGNSVWFAKSGSSTFVYLDVGGQPPPELMIELQNTTSLVLTANDFIGVTGGATDVNAEPVITSPATYTVAENSAAVGTVTATDADSPVLTYSLVGGGDAARFAINANTGALSFVTPPNFEAPADAGADNVYNLTVQVSDGISNTTQAIAVTVTDVVEAPNSAAPAITSPAAYTVAENATAVGAVTATDADSPVLTYSLVAGGDAALFTIDANTGALSFVTAPNFEAPADVGANNIYNLTVQVSDGALNTTQAIAVTVTDVVNETLTGTAGNNTLVGAGGNDVFTGNGGADLLSGNGGADRFVYAAAADSVPNANWAVPPDGTVTRTWDVITDFTQGVDKIDVSAFLGATDLAWGNTTPNGNSVWYAKSGSSTFIYLDVGGVPPPELMIELQNTTALVPIASDFIGVVGGASGVNVAPVITSPAAYTVAENGTAVGTVTATDADSPTLTYSLVAGGDAARFAINANTGALSFVTAPNFEAPADVGANNVYNLTVQVSDGALNTTQAIAVTVTDVVEAPVITSPAAYTVAENGTAVGTVTATDADSPTLTYSLVAGGDAARFAINANTGALSFVTAPNFEAPLDVGANNVYNLTVQVSDGALNTTQAIAVTVTDVVEAPNNASPVITSPAAYTVAENGTAVGTVTATDADSPTLTYSLVAGGDAARFAINANTGALSFVTAPNFEAPLDVGANNVYNLTVQVSDGALNTTQAIAVTVTDVVEAPVITSPAAYTVAENGTAVGTVTATDADSPTLTYSLVAGGDAARFAINANTGALSFVTAPNFEAPADMGANNVYNLTVQVSDGALNTTQAIAVTVTDVVEAPVITSPAAYTVAENGTAVGTVTATDADSPTLTYSLVAGGDAARFAINANTGALSFVTAPNFEAPADVGANNVYNLTVQVSDGALNTTQAIAVTVTDVANEGIVGTAGNDTLNGTAGNDLINISAGGNDTVAAGIGNDTILAGAAFNTNDRIDGGTETDDTVQIDTLVLDGNYAGGVTFGATTLVNVEEITLAAGNSYSLTTHNATVVASTLSIDGSALGAANILTVNAAAETEAGTSYVITGGAGNDVLTGGAGSDYFDISFGGNDIINGGGGRDTFFAGAALTAADQINGGAGTDFAYLSGNYGAGLTFGANTLLNVEVLVVQAGNNYNLTMNNAMLTGSQQFSVDGYSLGSGNSLTVNAAAETNTGTSYTLAGGAGNDRLIAGAGNDVLIGNGGNDTLTGGTGNDVFDFNAIADRGTSGDVITDFSRSGANGVDVLNLQDLLQTFAGYNGNNAFNGGYLQFNIASGTGTTVRVDTNGGANSYVTLATLTGVLLQQSDTANYVL